GAHQRDDHADLGEVGGQLRPAQGEDLIEWGRRQPHSLETKQEIIRRYSAALMEAAPLFRFMQENQATIRELRIGDMFKTKMLGLRDILIDPDADLVDQVRCISALFTLHAGMHVLQEVESDPGKRREAVLEVAVDLITQAHRHTAGD
ncbi:hypothetical protein ABZY58_31645, partial [Micromonospora tulbaghiae]|uniref:hypothetical protein n=1 Tax=Micromonospora tulbaghiae TaxID=479978 RepID=UPI0033A2CC1F